MKIGIVTITFNSGDVLIPFMECIKNQTYTDYFLYIVDNISTDNTLEITANYTEDKRIKIIANDKNVGVAAGNNQGIKQALEDGCDALLILNNDVEFEPTLLQKLKDQLLQHPEYDLVTCKMMYFFDKQLIWYAGSNFDRKNGWLVPHIGMLEKDMGQYDTPKQMEYAPTCCVLVNKIVFEHIGLMDEQYFAYFDDTDFFYRIHKDGRHKLLYYPFVEFYHKVGSLSKSKDGTPQNFKFGEFHIKLSTRNKVYYLRKQQSIYAWLNIAWFFIRMQLRFVASGKYNLNSKTYILLLKSFFQGLKMKI
ncbi:MAG: glycosyltransferase family 2 protein [Chitinophagales bacterium]|jgi:GT2 family glycosyltransferase|nr:glycosyltransferase family 2 protein [Chitinophagales bacterium]